MRVVIAVCQRSQDFKYLICLRSPHREFAGKWEFPGGKVEAGESDEIALKRELREELGLTGQYVVTQSLYECESELFPLIGITLAFYKVITFGFPTMKDHEGLMWVSELPPSNTLIDVKTMRAALEHVL